MVEIREAVAREKRRRGELGFDDMLSRLDDALRSESGEALASAIRQRFPVAMIDEFQDTDPQQYRIFAASGGGSRRRRCCLSAIPNRLFMPFAARISLPI